MSENDPRMPQDNNSNDPKGNESPVNFKGLIFLGIALNGTNIRFSEEKSLTNSPLPE